VYTFGLTLLAQDQPLDGVWTVRYHGLDGHSNTRYLTDALGDITDTYDYDAFGNLIAATGLTPNNFLFTSEQLDPDLGLYFLRARYQDTTTGRFWTMDEFEGFGTDPASLHKYTYCANDPINCFDSSGRFTLKEILFNNFTISMLTSIAVNYLAGERDWKKLLISAVLSGVTGLAAGKAVAALDKLFKVEGVGLSLFRLGYRSIINGSFAGAASLAEQYIDHRFFGGDPVEAFKVKAAFAMAVSITVLGDAFLLARGDPYADNPAAQESYEVMVGYIAEWAGVQADMLIDAARSFGRFLNERSDEIERQ
jgi:RHS repeat-associated protein